MIIDRSWEQRQLVYSSHPSGKLQSHAQCPIPIATAYGTYRIYFSGIDAKNHSRPFYTELDSTFTRTNSTFTSAELMDLGVPGAFDDSGVMPSCIVKKDNCRWMYYTGWNVGTTVPYRNAIGLAIAPDAEESWSRVFEGPVLDRSPNDPYFCATPFVLIDSGVWRMWYLSCTAWTFIDGRWEPQYLLKHAESLDGVSWRTQPRACLAPATEYEAIARPWVMKEDGLYRMWYCFRSLDGYRTSVSNSYRIGYAESGDGLRWKRLDNGLALMPSETGWDSEMTAYPSVIKDADSLRIFYNGNGFGRGGFGSASTSLHPT